MYKRQPHSSVIFQRIDDGAVLFAPATEVYFGLNEVGAKVWQLLPPTMHSLDELCMRLSTEYPTVEAEIIRQDVLELLDQLTAEGLVAPSAAGSDAKSAS